MFAQIGNIRDNKVGWSLGSTKSTFVLMEYFDDPTTSEAESYSLIQLSHNSRPQHTHKCSHFIESFSLVTTFII